MCIHVACTLAEIHHPSTFCRPRAPSCFPRRQLAQTTLANVTGPATGTGAGVTQANVVPGTTQANVVPGPVTGATTTQANVVPGTTQANVVGPTTGGQAVAAVPPTTTTSVNRAVAPTTTGTATGINTGISATGIGMGIGTEFGFGLPVADTFQGVTSLSNSDIFPTCALLTYVWGIPQDRGVYTGTYSAQTDQQIT